MGLLCKIVGRNSQPRAATPPANRTALADLEPAAAPPMSSAVWPPAPEPTIPPPLPCLLCGCPAVWSTIYEPHDFRCCDCEPPPSGWSHRLGGWRFVARRLLLVIWDEIWQWEHFPPASFRD